MKKIISVIVVLCLIPAVLSAFASCNNSDELTAAEFEKAITNLSGYTVSTTVTAANGTVATLTEKVSVSGDTVTVEETKKTPNLIGSATQYTTATDTKSYPTAGFTKFALKLSAATTPIIGEDGSFSGTFSAAQAKDACGIDASYDGDVTVKVALDAQRILQKAELSYKTTDGNTVTVTVTP